MMKRSLGRRMPAMCVVALLLAGPALAIEVTVQNDSVTDFSTVAVQAGFDPGESAAAWLKAPCSGEIVAVQIFWKSLLGGAVESLEDTIILYHGGTFPNPGSIMTMNYAPYNQAILEGPVMTDGVMNEFRYIDENSTVPIRISVNSGDIFVVSFTFYNDPNPLNGPSIVTDTNGCVGPANNALFSGGWINVCSAFPIQGDWVIRAVIDCQGPTGACCDANGLCTDDVEEGDCQGTFMTFYEGQTCAQVTCPTPTGACCNGTGGCLDGQTQAFCEGALHGVYAGNGTTCATQVCALGACCLTDGSCQNVIEPTCDGLGGTFYGAGSTCATTNCPQPTGACCLGTTCIANQTQANCVGFGGEWQGPLTTCGPPNPCAAPQPCRGDTNCDGQIDFGDINPFVDALIDNVYCDGTGDNADVNANGTVGFDDINPFVDLLTSNPLPIACP